MRGSIPTTAKLSRQCLSAALMAIAIGALPFTGNTVFAQGLVLEEIVVTAQRREQAIEEVPLSVSTMRGERLSSLFEGGEDIRALAGQLPGFYAESSNGRNAPRLYMRGLGNTDFDLAASQSVSLMIDEVVMENITLRNMPMFDYERVEVLRGPQGTLFGRNTPAGIIKFDTRKPTEEKDGYALATIGSMGTFNIEGAIGGALNDAGTVMGRFSVMSQHRDDWIDNSLTGENDALGGFSDLGWRGQLLLEPADDLSILLNVHGRDFEGTASIFRANVLDPGSNKFNSNYDRDTVAFNEGANNPQSNQNLGGSLRVDLDFENGVSMTSITALETSESGSEGDIDGGNLGGPGFIPFQSHSKDSIDDLSQFTQEIRFSGEGDDGFFWQGGFFYFDSNYKLNTNNFFAPLTTIQHLNEAWALFGQISLPLNDRLTLVSGMRYTDDDKEINILASPLPTDDVSIGGEQTSFDVSLLFDVNEDVNLYARLANGFRAPSIQARDVAFFGGTSTADSETILSYEVGFKMTMLDNKVRLNGAAFHYTIDDMQLTAVGGVGNLIQLINADSGEGTGIDIDADILITENLAISAGWSIIDTEIKDPDLRLAPCGSGACTILSPLDINGNTIVNGNQFPGAPDSTFNLTLSYTQPTDSGELFFVTDWARQGQTEFFLYKTAEYNTDGNYEGGIRAGYTHGDNDWQISVFGRNITDEENMKGGIEFNNNTAFDNEPRVWGITFRKNWSD